VHVPFWVFWMMIVICGVTLAFAITTWVSLRKTMQERDELRVHATELERQLAEEPVPGSENSQKEYELLHEAFRRVLLVLCDKNTNVLRRAWEYFPVFSRELDRDREGVEARLPDPKRDGALDPMTYVKAVASPQKEEE
jgi:hypothetical protein